MCFISKTKGERKSFSISFNRIYVSLSSEQSNTYLKQHAQILKLLDAIIEKFGEEQTLEIIRALNGISDVADEVIK